MMRIIARNSAPRRMNSAAALTKARMRNSTECTGFLAATTMTPVLPVADALVARGMPFVFATGYGERGLPEPYRNRPTLKKPFQMEGLKQMLQSALESGSARPTPDA